MNRRILKKHCKRAMTTLIEKHGYSTKTFIPAQGEESIDAPAGMKGRGVLTYLDGSAGWLNPGPLKGTPLIWRQVSYEYDEWDCFLPSLELAEIEFWAGMTDEEAAALCAPGLSGAA